MIIIYIVTIFFNDIRLVVMLLILILYQCMLNNP